MDNQSVNSFPDRYKRILEAYGITPIDLAERMGESESAVKFYRWQNGVQPRTSALRKMLDVLPGLSEDFLYRGIGPVKSVNSARAIAVDTEKTALSNQIAKLENEKNTLRELVDRKDQKIEKLEAKLEEYEKAMIEFARMGFPAFGSQSPALLQHTETPRIQVAGFGREPQTFTQTIQAAFGIEVLAGKWYLPVMLQTKSGLSNCSVND